MLMESHGQWSLVRRLRYPSNMRKSCPSCLSKSGVRKILYGMPDRTVDERKYALGGCCVSDKDPTLKCIECGWLGAYRSFIVPGSTVSRIFEGQDTYWITVDIDGKWLGGLYRYLHQEGSILEQYWDRKNQAWNHTIRLSKMISGDESSLERITERKARQLLPEAFKDRKSCKGV